MLPKTLDSERRKANYRKSRGVVCAASASMWNGSVVLSLEPNPSGLTNDHRHHVLKLFATTLTAIERP